MNNENLTPCIIIGAGRSGTNMLRDLLCSYPGISTWPCDEINYIWRRGNRAHPNDQFLSSLASASTSNYIRNAFETQKSKSNCNVLVEKTCANSLRMDFVDNIFPKANYIVILRDGRDVVRSAMQRWQAPLDLKYIAQKARFVPLTDIPYYALRYASHRVKKILSPDKSLPMWGPVYENMREHSKIYTVEELCAEQWISCVQLTLASLENIPTNRVCVVNYEALQKDPVTQVERILGFATGSTQLDRDLAKKLSSSIRHNPNAKPTPNLALRPDLERRFNSLLTQLDYSVNIQ